MSLILFIRLVHHNRLNARNTLYSCLYTRFLFFASLRLASTFLCTQSPWAYLPTNLRSLTGLPYETKLLVSIHHGLAMHDRTSNSGMDGLITNPLAHRSSFLVLVREKTDTESSHSVYQGASDLRLVIRFQIIRIVATSRIYLAAGSFPLQWTPHEHGQLSPLFVLSCRENLSSRDQVSQHSNSG